LGILGQIIEMLGNSQFISNFIACYGNKERINLLK
jgi:hypothetical protein